MFAGRILRAMPNTGDGYDMDAIAAAVIGGASLAGGRGAITGTFVGTLLMVVIQERRQGLLRSTTTSSTSSPAL